MNTITTSWPRSAYFVIVGLVILSASALYFVYSHTREAYRSVGFNDGQIHQREQLMESVRQSMHVGECDDANVRNTPIQFLSAKADAIYVLVAEDGSVRFCQ